MRHLAPLFLLCTALLAGCDDLSDSLGRQGAFQSLHAIDDQPDITFFVRAISRGTVDYSGNTGLLAVGAATYPIRFESRAVGELTRVPLDLPGSDPETGVLNVLVEANREYTYVLTGTAAQPLLETWERERRRFDDDSILATQYGHAAPSLGPVDIYVEAPGANLPGATPRASLAYPDDISDIDLPAGGPYVLTITVQGQVGTVLFESEEFDLTGATNVLFAVLEDAGLGTAPVLVRMIGDPERISLQDVNSPPELRAIHSAFNSTAVDFYLNEDFGTPLISNVDFQEISPYQSTTTGVDLPLDVTLNGDLNIIGEGLLALTDGVRSSVYLVGSSEPLSTVQILDDQRQLAEFAKLRLYQGAANYAFVDVYIIQPGDDYLDFAPAVPSLDFGDDSDYIVIDPNTYEVVVTPTGFRTTVLAGPESIDLAAGDISSILITDTADPVIAELIRYDDLAP